MPLSRRSRCADQPVTARVTSSKWASVVTSSPSSAGSGPRCWRRRWRHWTGPGRLCRRRSAPGVSPALTRAPAHRIVSLRVTFASMTQPSPMTVFSSSLAPAPIVTLLPMATGEPISAVGSISMFSPFQTPALFAQRDVQVDQARQSIEVGLPVDLQVADVFPVGGRGEAVEGTACGEEAGEDVVAEAPERVRRDQVEDVRLEDVDARVGRVGKHVAALRLFQKARDAAVFVGHDDAELRGVIHDGRGDGGGGVLLPVQRHQARQVNVRDVVAADDQKRLAAEELFASA